MVEHVKGVGNPADAMSRFPAGEPQACDEETVTVATVDLQAVTREELREATEADEVLQQLVEQIPRPWPKRYGECLTLLKPFFRCREELSFVDGLVFRGERLVVPARLRQRLLQAAHQGHQGMVRSKQRIRQLFWWPGQDSDVEKTVKECEVCAMFGKMARTRKAPLHPVQLPEGPWKKVGIDFIGPMQDGGKRERFAIVMVDYFSKWPEVG